jgi:hypothetical protein
MAWNEPHPSRLAMSELKPQTYAERAEHCEKMALRVQDPDARQRFVEMARRWRAMEKEERAGDAERA